VTEAKTRSQLGKANNSKGLRWNIEAADALRPIFPTIEVTRQNGRADIGGLTEWAIECKNLTDEYKLAGAVDQAVGDQHATGRRWHVVLKKTARRAPLRGLAVMTIEQWAQIAQLLDEAGI
jgi:hypothetical protein